MSDKLMENTVGKGRRTMGGATGIVLVLLAVGLVGIPYLAYPATAGVLDPNVVAFGASPSYINLNKTTSIEVEIGTSYGAGLDDYRVTVTAPDGQTASAWYNFTAAPETLGRIYGNASADFMTAVDQVGTYDLRLEYWNGAVFTLAGMAELRTTNQLRVVLVIRSGSNPFLDAHTCPVAQEFLRGAKFLGGGYVYYASTGETVTAANSNALGNVTGAFLGITRALKSPPLWHHAWKLPWDAPTGSQRFYLNASDGMGNVGSAVTGTAPFPRVTIVPDTLTVASRLVNGTGGETVTFAPGETLRLEVAVRYNDKEAHETVDDPNPVDPYNGPLTPARGGQVKAHLGYGAFNATLGIFATEFVNLTLTYSATTANWSASYTIPASTGNLTAVQAVITASDGASPANTGTVFTTQFAVKSPPAPEVIEVPRDVLRTTGFELPVVAGLAIALLIVGLGVGMAVSRRRKASAAPEAKPKEGRTEKPDSDSVDEWEEQK